MNENKVNHTVKPFYAQFEKLGELFGMEAIDKTFLRQARRFYGKQYFKELKYHRKAALRAAKWTYKDEKRAAKWTHTDEKRAAKRAHRADKRAERKAMRQAARDAFIARWRAFLARLLHKHDYTEESEQADPQDVTQAAETSVATAPQIASPTPQNDTETTDAAAEPQGDGA